MKTLKEGEFDQKYGKMIEGATWIIVIAIIFGVKLLPAQPINDTATYILVGAISAFALLYYLVIYKYFSKSNRIYLKNIADVVLIGVLIILLKDYGQYFFALYFLPLAAAALSLQFINALLIATIATLFVVFNIFLGAYGLLPQTSSFLQGLWQIILIIVITVFCRFMAIELKQKEDIEKEALSKQKALEEESKKEKEFLILASHQLYTPLSIIRGFSAMLSDKSLGELSLKQQKAAKEIYNNIVRMTKLVTELLSITKIQSGEFRIDPEPTDLRHLLTSVYEDFRQTTTNKKVEMKIDLENNLREISADSDKIRQACTNLIDNALKYTTSGHVTLSARQNNKETIISIIDTGIGIRQEDNEKIFQPFFRGKNILELDNRGTGLGLYIARLIIESHGGKIWYESSSKGTTFCFSIPYEIKTRVEKK